MIACIAFCMAAIVYVLGANLESEVAEVTVMMAFGTIIATLGSYVFGAAWQDVKLWKRD